MYFRQRSDSGIDFSIEILQWGISETPGTLTLKKQIEKDLFRKKVGGPTFSQKTTPANRSKPAAALSKKISFFSKCFFSAREAQKDAKKVF